MGGAARKGLATKEPALLVAMVVSLPLFSRRVGPKLRLVYACAVLELCRHKPLVILNSVAHARPPVIVAIRAVRADRVSP